MYDEFNYITDEVFLENYWNTEKLVYPYCDGIGHLSFDREATLVACHVCQGSGWVTHQQYEESMLLSRRVRKCAN